MAEALATPATVPTVHFTPGGPIIGGHLVHIPAGGGQDAHDGWVGGVGPLDTDTLRAKLQEMGVSGQDLEGILRVASDNTGNGTSWTQGQGFTMQGSDKPVAPPASFGAATGPAGTPGAPSGGGANALGGSGAGAFGGGGGLAGRPASPGYPGPGGMPMNGGGGGSSVSGSAFNALSGAGGGGIDFNAPLNFRNPGASGPGIGTTSTSPGANFYGRPNSIFSGLPANPTMGDVVGQVTQRQEENRNAALGILGNARGEMASDPLRTALNSRTAGLLANPYSLDEATMQRIMGQNNESIANRAALQSQTSADRAAAMGVTRSGGENTDQNAIQTNAANAMATGERQARIQQAVQNQQDVRSALGSALPVVGENQQSKNALDLSAVRDVLGTSSIYGDAFLSNLLMGGAQRPKVNLPNTYPGSGDAGQPIL